MSEEIRYSCNEDGCVCTCHIAPPCTHCVEHSYIVVSVELKKETVDLLDEAMSGAGLESYDEVIQDNHDSLVSWVKSSMEFKEENEKLKKNNFKIISLMTELINFEKDKINQRSILIDKITKTLKFF